MTTPPSAITDAPPVSPSRTQSAMYVLAVYSVAHFFVDLYSGAIGVYQPLLVQNLGLTLTQAGLLGGLLAFSSSVTQPVFGYLSDRYRSKLFTALAPAMAGIFIGALGTATSYGVALVMVVLGGSGISSFHPQGSAWSTAGMQTNRGRWMSVFISVGTAGYALSPVFYSEFLTRFGVRQSWWTMLGGVLVSLLMLTTLTAPPVPTHHRRGFDWAALRAVRKPLSILYFGVFFRSAVQVTYTQFLVLYLHRQLGYPLRGAAVVLSLYLMSGAIGGIAGGWLSDRMGPRRVMILSFGGSVPFLGLFFVLQGTLSIACLVLGGLILLFTIPVNVVVAQELVPQQAGTVSALMMGFAWGAAGMVFIPLAGWVSDHYSIRTALSGLLVFPLLGWWLTSKLPKEFGR